MKRLVIIQKINDEIKIYNYLASRIDKYKGALDAIKKTNKQKQNSSYLF